MKEVEFREGRLDPKHHVPEAKEAFDVNVPLAQACAPIFEQKPKNFKLLEGSDATFVIKVAGNPTPHVNIRECCSCLQFLRNIFKALSETTFNHVCFSFLIN